MVLLENKAHSGRRSTDRARGAESTLVFITLLRGVKGHKKKPLQSHNTFAVMYS